MTLALLSLLVAAYAAVLSTINLYTQRRDKQSRVKVSLTTGISVFAPGVVSDASLFLKASNPGHKAVVMNNPGLLLPDGRNVFFPRPKSDVNFPFSLEPERDCKVLIDLKDLANRLRSEGLSGKVKVVGFFYDAVGRQHKSKPYKIDVDMWSD